jgi:hypothetical protein
MTDRTSESHDLGARIAEIVGASVEGRVAPVETAVASLREEVSRIGARPLFDPAEFLRGFQARMENLGPKKAAPAAAPAAPPSAPAKAQ